MGHCDAMELRDREFFIYRISAGYVKYLNNDTVLYTYDPTIEELYDSKEYELEVYNDALLNMYQIEELKEELKSFGIWTEKDDAGVEGLPKEIEDLKVKMFENLMRSKVRENLRTHVRRAEQQLEEILLKRAEYDTMTCEGYSAFARSSWLVERCTRLKDGSKCDWDQFDFFKVMNNYFQVQPTEKQIRELAKTEPFRTNWAASKERIFDRTETAEITDPQKGLILWSKMYDGIHENPDCPSEDVIQDDDLLDGWLIYDRRKRETERNKNSAEAYDMDADEVFIPVQTDEDQHRVDNLNDPTSQMVIRQRHNQIQDAQSLKHSELTDVRRDLQVQSNEQYKNKVKG